MRRQLAPIAVVAMCCAAVVACGEGNDTPAAQQSPCVEVSHTIDLGDIAALTDAADVVVAVETIDPVPGGVSGTPEVATYTADPVATFKGAEPTEATRYMYETAVECSGPRNNIDSGSSYLVFGKSTETGVHLWQVEPLSEGDVSAIRGGNAAAYPDVVREVVDNVR